MFLDLLIVHFFLPLNCIPLCRYFFHLPVGEHLDCFPSWQLQITPPQTFMYKSLCEYISSFILDKHLEME